MALKLYGETDVQNIADEIRFYNEKEDKYRVEDMTLGIQDIAENIEDNLGTTRTVEGTSDLSYEDAKDYRIQEATYQGNVEQVTYTGKNLFDNNNLYNKVNAQGQMNKTGSGNICTMTKVSSGTASPRIEFNSDFFKINTTYYVTFKVKGDWNSLNFGTWINNTQVNLAVITPTSNEQIIKCSFTYPSTKYDNDRFFFRNNDEVVSVGQTLTISDFMISTTDTDFEPYTGGTPAPNPDYPQEIKCVKGWNIARLEDKELTSKSLNFEVKNGTITINGTSSDTAFASLGVFYDLEPGNYTIQAFNEDTISGTNPLLRLTDSNGTQYGTGANMNNKNAYSTSTSLTEKKQLQLQLRIPGGVTLTNFKVTPQLLKGTQSKPYLPYNSIGVKRIGKNLFDSNKKPDIMRYSTDIISFNNNVLTMSKTNTNVQSRNYWVMPCKANETYTINCLENGNAGISFSETIITTDTEGQALSYPKTLTTSKEGYIIVRLIIPTANTSITFTNLQLEKGNATLYEPYQERIDYIDIKGNELCKIGDVKDELKIDEKGNVKLIKRIGKVVLDGRESFSNNVGYINAGRFAINNYTNGIKGSASQPGAISTHFNGKFETSNGSIFLSGVDNLINFMLVDYANKLDDLRTWLSQNKPIVYYILAASQEINLGKIKVKSLEGLNNVSILAEVEPTTMSETYMLDAQSKYLPKVTTEDTKIDYVAQFPLDIKMDGNSKQETTTGKNLFEQYLAEGEVRTQNGITITYGKGTILINGTATANAFFQISRNIEGKTGESYVLYHNNDKISQSTGSYIRWYQTDIIQNFGSFRVVNRISSLTLTSDQPSGSCLQLRINEGDTFDNITIKPMLIKGTSTSEEYEPFTNGASPNPEYPQEIECVKGWNLYNGLEENSYANSVGSIVKNASSQYIGISEYIECEPNTTYSVYFEHDISSKTMWVSFKDKSGVFISRTSYTTQRKFTTPSNAYQVYFYLYDSDGKFTNLGNAQLVKREEQKPYLPYNSIGVKIVGKNIIPNEAKNQTINGIQYTINGDKSITCVGTATSISDLYLWGGSQDNGIYLEIPQGEYALSSVPDLFFVRTKDDGVLFKAHLVNTLKTKSVKIFGIVLRINQNSSVNTTYYPQLEQGSVATDYEPYKELTSYIDIKGNELCKIGDFMDELKIDEKGNIKLVKRIGKIILDGTQTWATGSGGTFRTQDNTLMKKDGVVLVGSSHYKGASPCGGFSEILNRGNGRIALSKTTYTSNALWICDTRFNTIAELNAWLEIAKPVVYYVLATPEEIDLGKQEKLIPLEGINNIEVLAELEPSKMETTYYIDAKKYIEDMTNTLLDFGGES